MPIRAPTSSTLKATIGSDSSPTDQACKIPLPAASRQSYRESSTNLALRQIGSRAISKAIGPDLPSPAAFPSSPLQLGGICSPPDVLTLPGHQSTLGLRISRELVRMNTHEPRKPSNAHRAIDRPL